MGKRLIQQARGKGGPRYRAPSFKYKGKARHRSVIDVQPMKGRIMDIIKCRGHSAPLAIVEYEDGESCLAIAPEGIRVGQEISNGSDVEIASGNSTEIMNLPEGTLIYNIESRPGDGGKFCRAGGSAARVISKSETKVVVLLPSKKKKMFDGKCRASIGIVSGGGRLEKPLLKAGNAHYKAKAKNKLYPIVSGSAMNAVDHPFGNARSSRKSKAKPISKNAPPGRKVGAVGAKRTGRRKK